MQVWGLQVWSSTCSRIVWLAGFVSSLFLMTFLPWEKKAEVCQCINNSALKVNSHKVLFRHEFFISAWDGIGSGISSTWWSPWRQGHTVEEKLNNLAKVRGEIWQRAQCSSQELWAGRWLLGSHLHQSDAVCCPQKHLLRNRWIIKPRFTNVSFLKKTKLSFQP